MATTLFSATILAIDIGSKTLKGVVLSQRGGTSLLLRGDLLEFDPALKPGSAAWSKEIAQFVKNCSKKSPVRVDTLHLFASFEGIVCRTFLFPAMPESELKQALEWQIQEQIQGELADTYWDYQISKIPEKPDQIFAFAAAVPRESIDKLLAAIRSENIWISVIDVSPLPSFSLLSARSKIQNALLIDIGSKKSDFSLFMNAQLALFRRADIGGQNITNSIANSYAPGGGRLTFEQGEALKRESGLMPKEPSAAGAEYVDQTAPVRALVRQGFDAILQELKRFLLFCQENLELVKLDGVILYGGEARLSGAVEYIRQQIGEDLPIETFDPFEGLTFALPREGRPSEEELRPQGLSFVNAIAIGKAAKGLQLISPAAKTKRFVLAQRGMIGAALLLLILMGSWYTSILKEHRILKRESDQIQQQTNQLRASDQRYMALTSDSQQFSGRLQRLQQLVDAEPYLLKYLPAIGKEIPDDAILTKVEYDKKSQEILLEGVAIAMDRSVEQVVTSMVTFLEQSEAFEWVSVVSQTIVPGEKRALAKFVLAVKGRP